VYTFIPGQKHIWWNLYVSLRWRAFSCCWTGGKCLVNCGSMLL